MSARRGERECSASFWGDCWKRIPTTVMQSSCSYSRPFTRHHTHDRQTYHTQGLSESYVCLSQSVGILSPVYANKIVCNRQSALSTSQGRLRNFSGDSKAWR